MTTAHPTSRFRKDLFIALALAAAASAFFAISGSKLNGGLVDDAFIFLRVADNIRDGHGWTYNSDLDVNPITAPFYVLVLVAARSLGLTGETTLSAVYVGGLAITCGALFFISLPLGRSAAVAVALAISTGAAAVKPWGMETSVFLACVTCAVVALSRRKAWIAGVACGLATLCRPEGVALIGLSMAVLLWSNRRVAWQALLGFILVVGPWMTFSLVKFNELMPNSVSVKSIQSHIGWFKTQPGWFEYFLHSPAHPIPTFVMAGVGVLSSIWILKEKAQAALILMCFCAIQVVAYSAKGAPVGYFWYLTPGLVAVDLAVILGFVNVLGLVSERVATVVRPTTGKHLARLSLLIAVAASTQLISRPFASVLPYRLGSEYSEIGRWIGANTKHDAVVAAAEIGYIGFYSERNIRDMHGLLHPEAVPQLLKENWSWWFHDPRPEVVVVHSPPWHGEPSTALGWPDRDVSSFNAEYCRVKSTARLEVYQSLASARSCL